MTDPRENFRPADLLGVAPRAPVECDASAQTPLAAAFLAGLGVPEHARNGVEHLIISTTPYHGYGDDGSQSWEWDAPGVAVRLCLYEDGESDAYVRIASVQPEFVDGEVVKPKEIEA